MKVFKEKKNKAESKPSCIRRKQIFDVYEKRLECKKKIAENQTKKFSMIMKFLCSQKFDVDHVLLGFYLREHYYYYYYYYCYYYILKSKTREGHTSEYRFRTR